MADFSRTPCAISLRSNSSIGSGSPLTRSAPDDDECPYRRDTVASIMNGERSVRQWRRPRAMACHEAIGSLPSTTSPGMLNARPRSRILATPGWLEWEVEMPHPLLVTMISTGNALPGGVLQTRQEAKSPSAVPASPPVTMVTPSPPTRFCTWAVPGAMTYCTSITDVTGMTFQSLAAKWPAKLRPRE